MGPKEQKAPVKAENFSWERKKRKVLILSFSQLLFLHGRRQVDDLSVDLGKAHEGRSSRWLFPLILLRLKIRVAVRAVQGNGEPEEIGITVELLSTFWAFHIYNVHGGFLA